MNSLLELKNALASKTISAREATQSFIKDIKQASPLNAFIHICEEEALAQADHADNLFQKGEARPLEGVPLGIKDLFCTQNIPTSAASKILENFVPDYESTVTRKLKEAGAVILGKLNMDEFAMGSSNETSHFGACVNPWRAQNSDKPLVPGGSSGGVSASVAAQLCSAGLGSDTGGSLRQPASFTGTVGLKPSYGRCSRWGMIAFASSLDQAGVITRNVADSAFLLSIIAGGDDKDSTSSHHAVPDYLQTSQSMSQKKRPLTIGIAKEYHSDNQEIEASLEEGRKALEAQGAVIKDIELNHTKYALPAYYIIAPAEASSNLARYDGVRFGLRIEGGNLAQMYRRTRGEGFGEEVKRRILIGTYALSAGYYDAYYLRALKVRQVIAREFAKAFEQVDVILTPTTNNDAFEIGSQSNPLDMYLNDIYTVPASLAGLPAISVPARLSKRALPLGLQIIAPAFGEEMMFYAASLLEREMAFDASPQKWWRDGNGGGMDRI